jgi:hypothetical protein
MPSLTNMLNVRQARQPQGGYPVYDAGRDPGSMASSKGGRIAPGTWGTATAPVNQRGWQEDRQQLAQWQQLLKKLGARGQGDAILGGMFRGMG